MGFYKDSGVSDESVPPAGVEVCARGAGAGELLPRLAADYGVEGQRRWPTGQRGAGAGRFSRAKQLALRERNLDEPTRRALAAATEAGALPLRASGSSVGKGGARSTRSLVTGTGRDGVAPAGLGSIRGAPESWTRRSCLRGGPGDGGPRGPDRAGGVGPPVAQDARHDNGVPAMAGVCGRV